MVMNMKTLTVLIKRNIKLFFKDRGMFLTSLVTPAILLVLYSTFLGKMYRDSFISAFPEGAAPVDGVADGMVAAQLISSILSVSCVTVAFFSNFLMVQDKANGTVKDLRISPVKPSTLSLGYYIANLISTLIICLAATGISLAYVAVVGWYMSVGDVLLLIFDVVLLSLFGTALSSVINFFLSTQGQISAAGSIISAGYGFICGAYMPISSFGTGLQRVLGFLPGTYGTSLIRNHSLNGPLREMSAQGVPYEVTDEIRAALDCDLSFFGDKVSVPAMYLILACSVAVLLLAYIWLNSSRKRA